MRARITLLCSLCVGLLAACGGDGSPFTHCVADADCNSGNACYQLTSGAGVCLSPCDGTSPTCEGGQACATVTSGGFVCLPGGDITVGAPCGESLECTLGALCIDSGAGGICRSVCDPAAAACPGAVACVSLDADRGYCGTDPATDMGPVMDMGSADAGP